MFVHLLQIHVICLIIIQVFICRQKNIHVEIFLSTEKTIFQIHVCSFFRIMLKKFKHMIEHFMNGMKHFYKLPQNFFELY